MGIRRAKHTAAAQEELACATAGKKIRDWLWNSVCDSSGSSGPLHPGNGCQYRCSQQRSAAFDELPAFVCHEVGNLVENDPPKARVPPAAYSILSAVSQSWIHKNDNQLHKLEGPDESLVSPKILPQVDGIDTPALHVHLHGWRAPCFKNSGNA